MKQATLSPIVYHWDLSPLYKNRGAWLEDLAEVKQLAQKLLHFRGISTLTVAALESALQLQSRIFMLLDKLYIYPKLRLDLDYQDEEARQMCDMASHASRRILSDIAFLADELRSLDESLLAKTSADSLANYRRLLQEFKRFGPHMLDADQEDILAQLHQITGHVYQTYRILREQETVYPDITDASGENIVLLDNNYPLLMEHPDRNVRKQAYYGVMSALHQKRETFASLLKTYALQLSLNAGFRRHESSFAAALFEEEIHPEIYGYLINAVHLHLNTLHHYINLRKKLLGVTQLGSYDLLAPLPAQSEPVVGVQEGLALIESSLAPLGEEYYDYLAYLIGVNCIDFYPDSRKTDGAYTWNVYDVYPYILLNYNNNTDSLFGLVHELGHAVHYMFTNRHQPYIYADCPVFLSEIVSNVNECLLIRHLLEHAEDSSSRLYYLSYYIEMFRSTVFRQSLLAEFEHFIYSTLDAEQPLNASLLCETYKSLTRSYYGDGLLVEDLQGSEWIRASHLYKNFYMFKYPVGYLIALQIVQNIHEQGARYAEKYTRMLKAGNAAPAVDLLRTIDIDVDDPNLYGSGLRIFESLITNLEEACYA
ncbi:M3 family oligoendopeptidase [Paenibacillus macerans]|uniref:M3 family oligoendopeptidase n=1 Tax=Paenibacillus macerans TaxID=44252 RepID=UPI002E24948B|nr:oligoendopeptidase F family protein [Paenibacillus macerans]